MKRGQHLLFPTPRHISQTQCPTLQGAGHNSFCLGNPVESVHAFQPTPSLKPFGMIPSGPENVLLSVFYNYSLDSIYRIYSLSYLVMRPGPWNF